MNLPGPGVFAACATMLSVLSADVLRDAGVLTTPWPWFVASGTCAGWALLGAPRRAHASILLLALYVMLVGWTLAKSVTPARDHLSRLVARGDRILQVEGIAISEARKPVRMDVGALSAFDYREPYTRFIFEARRLIVAEDGAAPSDGRSRAVPVRGRMWTYIPDDVAPRIRPGALLRLTGNASRVDPPLNPAARDFRPHALEDGVAGFLGVPHGSLIEPAANPPLFDRMVGVFYRVRGYARERSSRALLDDEAPSPGRALLSALLLGERDVSLRPVHVSFTRLGLSHLLAISGLNLVVLAGAFALLLRVLFTALSAPLSIAWRAEPILVSLVVAAYLFVLPVQPSILRAGIMTLALLIPAVIGRRHDRVNVLGWTLVLILIRRPHEMYTLGLQLSFGVVLALLTLTNPLRDRVFGRVRDPATLSSARRAARGLETAFVGATVAWLVSAPTIVHHTGFITPLAIPATLLGAPVMSALTATGYLMLIVSTLLPGVAHTLMLWLAQGADALATAASFVDDLPFAMIRTPWVSAWLACAGTLVIVSWLLVPRDALLRFPRRARAARLAATAVVAVWAALEFRAPSLRPDVALRVDTMYVQDGSCLLLRAGDSGALWDGGGSRFDLGVRTLPDAFRKLRARNIRDAFLTHPNLDHFNALPDLFRALGVERLHTTRFVLRAAETDPDGPEAALLALASRHGVRVLAHSAGDVIPLGPARVRILWPPHDLPADTHDNDTSLVARFELPDVPASGGVLLTGDIQAPAMRGLLADPGALRASILELPHHGSAGSMPMALRFVEAVRPSIILQSTGIERVNDARWDSARGTGVTWLVTATRGASWGEVLRDGTLRSGAMHPP